MKDDVHLLDLHLGLDLNVIFKFHVTKVISKYPYNINFDCGPYPKHFTLPDVIVCFFTHVYAYGRYIGVPNQKQHPRRVLDVVFLL